MAADRGSIPRLAINRQGYDKYVGVVRDSKASSAAPSISLIISVIPCLACSGFPTAATMMPVTILRQKNSRNTSDLLLTVV